MCRTCYYYETCICKNCGALINTEYLVHDQKGRSFGCADCIPPEKPRA